MAVGAVVLGKTRIGYETYAVGGNETAADLCRHPLALGAHPRLPLRCARRDPRRPDERRPEQGHRPRTYGQGAELIVIAAVIVGGASILGGRGRVLGSVPRRDPGRARSTRCCARASRSPASSRSATSRWRCSGWRSCRPARCRPSSALILLVAVLIEPYVVRAQLLARASRPRLTGRPLAAVLRDGGVAIVAARDQGHAARSRAASASTGWRAFFYPPRRRRRSCSPCVLWLVGFYLRPDFWGSLDNTFNLLLAFTEIALLAIGLTFVIANGDIDLSVGSVLRSVGLHRRLPDEARWASIRLYRGPRRARRRHARRRRQRRS